MADEAVALAAVHAGLTAAYGYPGTPSTEILEYLIRHARTHGGPRAEWCANEKTAYEAALGVSFAGRRTMVTMKHVGLNVAADPFMNSALVTVNGGLVVAVADDPGMHSSQNEQDSRVFADFARVVCLEPASHQEAYEMTREAFDISERFHVPVMIRLVTRLAHSRGIVEVGEARGENPPHKNLQSSAWVLLPGNARRQWRALLDRFDDIRAYVSASRFNSVESGSADGFGVITTGLARNYFLENLDDLAARPAHLHIGAYPYPVETIRAFVAPLQRVLLLEEGYPYVERALRGIVPPAHLEIQGRESGAVPPDGELNPDIVRAALGLPARSGVSIPGLSLPGRPPQLCAGCPHGDSFHSITSVLAAFPDAIVTADIGCSTLGALPPYNAIETCVCMGASIGMAKGAADAGYHPVVAVIGDSTFLHSGVTALMDAVAADTPMTLRHPRQQDGGDDGRAAHHPDLVRARSPGARPRRAARSPARRGGPPEADGREHGDSAPRGQPPRPVGGDWRARVHRDRQAQQAGEDRDRGRGPGVTTMTFDIILAGVGGQGVLSVSAIIASSAMKEGLAVKQSEVHGMSQRGGAVLANLRLSDHPIASDLIPRGSAALILSMEPLESLRYLEFLSASGTVITATNPVANIADYPPVDDVLAHVRSLPHALTIDAEALARKAGSARATNMVMVGAASPMLPVSFDTIEHFVETLFAGKGANVVEINLRALHAGRAAASR